MLDCRPSVLRVPACLFRERSPYGNPRATSPEPHPSPPFRQRSRGPVRPGSDQDPDGKLPRLPAGRSRWPRNARTRGWRPSCARSSRSRATTSSSSWSTCKYELGKPRYTPDECRQLRLTYGRPFRLWLRLNKEQPIEEEVYLGDLPIMLGGGEFIINGAERVVVSQLHRSPGIDFVMEQEGDDRPQAAQLPRDSRTRQLDRDQRHQEGTAQRPHRPERQVLGDHAAAGDEPQVQHRPGHHPRRSTRPPWKRSSTAAA